MAGGLRGRLGPRRFRAFAARSVAASGGRSLVTALAAAVALLAATPAAPVGWTAEEWPSPSAKAPADPWRIGRPEPGFDVTLAALGWSSAIVLPEAGDRARTPGDALRRRDLPREVTGAANALERVVMDAGAPLARDPVEDLLLAGRARVDALVPPPTLLRRGPDDPPDPWAIAAPSFLFEMMRVGTAALTEESRLGLADLLLTGFTVIVAPSEAIPNWPEDIRAQSDPVIRGLTLAAPAPRPDQPDDPLFIGLVVLGALGFGVLALVGIVYAIIRESDGPKKLRSRRFG